MKEKIERYYLEILSKNNLKEKFKPSEDYKIELISSSKFELNKFFYKQIGKKHQWIDRLIWKNNDWIKYVSNKNLKTYILKKGDDLVGFFELIFNQELRESEIAYLGILEEYFKNGCGGYLLTEAIKKSFEAGAKRVWVHTCSLDHPNAIENYKSRGMTIFKTEVLSREAV
tara:strand:- start:199 stop:711 length:513 start_codon:yes stop_codon:yes gene_type:complete